MTEHQHEEARHAPRPRRGYFSRFGGLWTDLHEADERIARQLTEGTLTEAEAGQLRFWIQNGYLVLEGAVPAATIDRVVSDVEAA